MSGTTRVSVPGKLILMGEHAAVYGRPALVAAIGSRLHVRVAGRSDGVVAIDLPPLGYRATTTWPAIRSAGATARQAWQAFVADPGPERFRALRSADAGALVCIALAEVAAGRASLPGLDVRVESELPVGAGLGSSAAAAVGVVAATLATLDEELDWTRVPELALEVERRQHGLPSGIDTTTVFHGGVLWIRRVESGLVSEPVAVQPGLISQLHVYDTGRPAEGTGEVVAAVRGRRDAATAEFDRILERMEEATRTLRALLESADAGMADLLAPVRAFQRCLQEIGVVPAPVRAIVTAVERAGGAAKISGAGALSGKCAGCMIVVHPDPEVLSSLPALQPLRRIEAPLGVEGTRLESIA